MAPHPNEDRLAESASGGDTTAMEHLMVWYAPAVERHVASKLGEEDRRRFDAADVVQDAFVRAFAAIGRFENRGEGAFYAWLRTIADSALEDARKFRNRRKRSGKFRRLERGATSPDESSVDLVDRLASPTTSPSLRAVRNEAVASLRAAVAALPDRDARVIQLKLLDGMSDQQVADALETTTAAVRGICHRAKSKLKEILDVEGAE